MLVETIIKAQIKAIEWAIPVFVWPPGMEDSGIPAAFYLAKPYGGLRIIVTFVGLIHGNKMEKLSKV